MTSSEARARRKSLAGPKLSRAERKEQSSARRTQMSDRRERMMNGDERYLLSRDQGPVRRYVRDIVDARRNVLGLFMPSALGLMFFMFAIPQLQLYVSPAMLLLMLVMALDGLLLGRKVARKVDEKFPRGHRKPLEAWALRDEPGLPDAPDAGTAAPGQARRQCRIDHAGRLIDPQCEPWCSVESGQESPGGRRPPSPSPSQATSPCTIWRPDSSPNLTRPGPQRVAEHRDRRPQHWRTVETQDIAAQLRQSPDTATLVDDIGGWLTATLDRRQAWDGGSVSADLDELH